MYVFFFCKGWEVCPVQFVLYLLETERFDLYILFLVDMKWMRNKSIVLFFFSSFLPGYDYAQDKPRRTPRRHCRHHGLTTQNKNQM